MLLGPLDRTGIGLQLQLRQALISAIHAGRLLPGTRIPPIRILAETLALSRNTVAGALRSLIESGELESRPRSGIWVRDVEQPASRPPVDPAPDNWRYPPALRPSLFGGRCITRDEHDHPFPFRTGQIDPALFPVAAWREATRAATSVGEIRNWTLGRVDGDDPQLVAELCRQVLPTRGIWASTEEVMITMGAQHGLSLIAQLFLTGGRRAALEEPGYPPLRSIVRLFTPSISSLDVDTEGAVPGPGVLGSDVVFLTCASQCPTNAPLSAQRRQWFLDLAARAGAMIVDDDSGADLLPDGRPLALKSQDRTGNVLHVGSLTNTLAPGLRLGFVVGPADIMNELRALRHLTLRQPPANNQRTMALFLSLGHYRTHMARQRDIIAERRSACAMALDTQMPGLTHTSGPASFWLTLPQGVDGMAIAEAARREGVDVEPGAPYFADPNAGRRTIRLGLGAIRTDRIAPGIERLARAIARSQTAGL